MPTEVLPENIGPYQVVGLLGKGGMGSVYKAFKPPLRRYVAIKIIKSEFTATPGALDRFRREAELASDLKHPNIVTVFDYEEVPNGDSYIVTELIEGGETLRDRMMKSPLSLTEISDILNQTASALDYAYEKAHIVHRDIKPSNIFLESGKRVALGDFGIAKDISSDTALTAVNQGIGTPDYMSPEQAINEGIDRRSDIYSLGVVLYEMLTGRVPFVGDTPISIVLAHIQKPVPPLTDFKTNLSPAIQQVINKALAKRKEERYNTAGEMAEAFKSAISSTGAAVVQTQSSQAPTELIATGATAAGMIAAQVSNISQFENQGRYQEAYNRLDELHRQFPQDPELGRRYQAYRDRGYTYTGTGAGNLNPNVQPQSQGYNPVPTPPPGQYTAPTQQNYQSQPGNQYNNNTYSAQASGPYAGYANQSSTPYPVNAPTKKSSNVPLIAGGVVVVVVLGAILAIVLAGGGDQKNKDATATARAVAAIPTVSPTVASTTTPVRTTAAPTTAAPTTAVPTTVPPTTVPATTPPGDPKKQAQLLGSQADDLYNQKKYDESAAKYKQAIQLNPNEVSFYEGLTHAYYYLDQYSDMEEPARKAVELNPKSASNQYYLGYAYYWTKRYTDAEKYFKAAVDLKPDDYLYQQYEARALLSLERYKEAETFAKKAIELNAAIPENHNTLGRVYEAEENYPEAEKEFRVAISQKSDSVIFQYNLALTLNDEGKYKEAEVEALKATKLDSSYYPAYQSLSIALRNQNKFEEALLAARKATDLDPKVSYNHLQVALALNRLKRYSEAEVAARKAIELDPSLASGYNTLGDAYYNQGKYPEALDAYTNAVKNYSRSYLYFTNQADTFAKLKQYDKARDAYNRALALKADYQPAIDGLAAVKDK